MTKKLSYKPNETYNARVIDLLVIAALLAGETKKLQTINQDYIGLL
jgi:hypothetical protein